MSERQAGTDDFVDQIAATDSEASSARLGIEELMLRRALGSSGVRLTATPPHARPHATAPGRRRPATRGSSQRRPSALSRRRPINGLRACRALLGDRRSSRPAPSAIGEGCRAPGHMATADDGRRQKRARLPVGVGRCLWERAWRWPAFRPLMNSPGNPIRPHAWALLPRSQRPGMPARRSSENDGVSVKFWSDHNSLRKSNEFMPAQRCSVACQS
jgi:hypothetical protein